MISTTGPTPAERERLARALGEYWYSGIGPTHDDVNRILDRLEIAFHGDHSKRQKVSSSIEAATDKQLPRLVAEYVDLLEGGGYLDPADQRYGLLHKALRPFKMGLDAGQLTGVVGIGVDPEQMPALPAVREHIERIQRAIRDDDAAQLIGSAKELLESTSKMVLASNGETPPPKFPALLSRALEVLKLDPKSPPVDRPDLVEPVRRILGGAKQIAISVNELRNDYGTGHGRPEATVRLERRQARLAAGAAVVVATLMLDTFEDPDSPWRRSRS